MSGPSHPLEELPNQLHSRMEIEGSTGGDMLHDLVSSGMFASMEHFNAPLPDGNIMKFQLLKETNRDVATALPCKVWHAAVAHPDIRGGHFDLGGQHPPVKDMEMHGTFLTLQAANSKAERVLEELKAEMGRTAVIQKSYLDGVVMGFVLSGQGSSVDAKTVQVACDDGRIQQVDRSGNPLQT
ncbi:hypothetical protein G647_08330 [Cladophialophora carrionii CBS 160.54]|uniref:Uncharacterized protein n=1 Tax=Cladophialophora carrionii CBS 160.54 TaxID=1279043 RepID=V9D0W9_9EURO|nr:uncharacterized protein G647_08330 [Cladophialophora carrionii CBS 160.54]ETI20296.1 hypothetical protein G647_08330 [Cladophialophora carrionii CBS 160.54]